MAFTQPADAACLLWCRGRRTPIATRQTPTDDGAGCFVGDRIQTTATLSDETRTHPVTSRLEYRHTADARSEPRCGTPAVDEPPLTLI